MNLNAPNKKNLFQWIAFFGKVRMQINNNVTDLNFYGTSIKSLHDIN